MDGKNCIGNRETTLNTPTIKHLFNEWTGISIQLQSALCGRSNLFLFLDYDGTLVTIVDTPKKALLPPERKLLLYKLSQCSEIKLWIVTGRSINDIRRLVGVDGIGYVGNHGFEIQCPNQPLREFYPPVHRETIRKIQELLNAHFVQYKGLFFENKGPILAIHYRLAKAGIEQEILRVIESIKDGWHGQTSLSVAHGKKVIEIRTASDKSKGTALEWIRKNVKNGKNICMVYLGDDETDEDAFRVLNVDDIGVFVGKPTRQTAAKYYLLTVDEVWDFLQRIYELLRK